MRVAPGDFPDALETARLTIRAVRPDDALALNEAVRESFAELHPWMPWAGKPPTMAESVKACLDMRVKWLLREELMLLFFRRHTGELVGAGGFHHINWNVPALETGYWCRTRFTGHGYISEALRALSEYVLDGWRVSRIAITCDERNERSWRVAERAGYELEGVLHYDQLDRDGRARVTRIYARLA
jgi:RimJ/RimL family protein N-acetyltransferase